MLQELVRRWDNHKIMNKYMKMFFMYLDRFYVKYHALPTLEESGMKHFKSIVYEGMKLSIASAVVSLINDERENIDVDKGLIRSVVEIFEAMGMGSMDTYEQDLEAPLLLATR